VTDGGSDGIVGQKLDVPITDSTLDPEVIMDFAEVRELVRLRYELRRLRSEGRADEARALLARMWSLAEADPAEAAEVQPELARWEFSLR